MVNYTKSPAIVFLSSLSRFIECVIRNSWRLICHDSLAIYLPFFKFMEKTEHMDLSWFPDGC